MFMRSCSFLEQLKSPVYCLDIKAVTAIDQSAAERLGNKINSVDNPILEESI